MLIVGAGPSGIFACFELIRQGFRGKIGLVDMGQRVAERKKNEVMCGFGGAGTYSDGKLHYTPKLSHERALEVIPLNKYQKILNSVEKTFHQFGVNAEYYPKNPELVKIMTEECERKNIELIVRRAQHVGTDNLKSVISKMEKYLLENGIDLVLETEIKDLAVKKNKLLGAISTKGTIYWAKKILLAPGRVNAAWLQRIAKKHGIKFRYGMVEIGVRVEFPESIMKRYADNLYEIVFKLRTSTYDDIIRTFCSCPNGYVSVENYQGYISVNGHSDSKHDSKNSNFAFVCEVNLTEPVENSIAYAESIAIMASTIGGGKPILQRLADLKKGRRSNWKRIGKSIVEPTLKEVTPGDISMALPHRTVTNILEGLEKLDRVMPGIDSGSTLLYAPEVKFRSSQVLTDKKLETSLKNVFVAGDAAGLSGSITGAAATGMVAARGMLR